MTSARAQAISLGDLICAAGPDVPSTETSAQGNTRKLSCVFVSPHGLPRETYSGSLFVSGSNEELEESATVIFAVRGPSAEPGMLSQDFVGQVVDKDGRSGPLAGSSDASISLNVVLRKTEKAALQPVRAAVKLELDAAVA